MENNKEISDKLKEIYGIAGKELIERLLEIFKEDSLEKWFYKPLQALNGKSAYDVCIEKNKHLLEKLVEEMEQDFYAPL